MIEPTCRLGTDYLARQARLFILASIRAAFTPSLPAIFSSTVTADTLTFTWMSSILVGKNLSCFRALPKIAGARPAASSTGHHVCTNHRTSEYECVDEPHQQRSSEHPQLGSVVVLECVKRYQNGYHCEDTR
jgi:hypothetical protein